MTLPAAPAPAAPDDRIGATAVVATTAALVSLVLTSIVLSPSASANRPDPTVGLEPVGTVRDGGSDPSAAEAPAVDPGTERASVVDAHAGTVDVLDLGDPAQPRQVGTLEATGATSVAVHDGLVAVVEDARLGQRPGSVVVVDAQGLARLGQTQVGALPDMVLVTPG